MRAGAGCSCVCVRTFRSPRGSVSINITQSANAFLQCGNPARLQELADSLTTRYLLQCGQKWLAAFTPYITDNERRHAGCQHRLFFAQVEYCDNMIFHCRAAVEELAQRLLDLNRNIGQPKKVTTIFGRKVTKEYKGKLQSVIEDLDLPNPVIRSHYGHGFAQQYVRDDRLLVYDYGVKKDVEKPSATPGADVRDHRQLPRRSAGRDGNLHRPRSTAQAAEPTVLSSATGRNARAGALRRYSLQAEGSPRPTSASKLRAKGLVERIPHSCRYRLAGKSYSICVAFLKLFEKIYAPLTAGLLQPFRGDRVLAEEKRCELDRIDQRVCDDLDALLGAVGLKLAA